MYLNIRTAKLAIVRKVSYCEVELAFFTVHRTPLKKGVVDGRGEHDSVTAFFRYL